jgi:hypothetical protein
VAARLVIIYTRDVKCRLAKAVTSPQQRARRYLAQLNARLLTPNNLTDFYEILFEMFFSETRNTTLCSGSQSNLGAKLLSYL